MRNDEGNALGWHVPAFQAEERAAGYAQLILGFQERLGSVLPARQL
jgi:hypothetical protein